MGLIFLTATAAYVLDEMNSMLTRYPREYSLSPDHDVDNLRRDGEKIPYKLVGELVVGQPARFILQIREDGVPTMRTTTPVIGIMSDESPMVD